MEDFRTIWKYPLEIINKQKIKLPGSYKILSIKVQNGKPILYVFVNPKVQERVDVTLITYGTGHSIDTNYDNVDDYIDTYMVQDGKLVFHVFKRHC
jgi:hypothetical protein